MEPLTIVTLIAAVATLVTVPLRGTALRQDRMEKGFSDSLRSGSSDLPVRKIPDFPRGRRGSQRDRSLRFSIEEKITTMYIL
ncbi:MAG: hypothetical protein AABZ02_07990 [Bacteroidota bacterium]